MSTKVKMIQSLDGFLLSGPKAALEGEGDESMPSYEFIHLSLFFPLILFPTK